MSSKTYQHELVARLEAKDTDPLVLLATVVDAPELVGVLLDGRTDPRANVRYGSDKLLRLLSERHPQMLAGNFDLFAENLSHENSFLRWGATFIVASLAGSVSEQKVKSILKKYLAPLRGDALVGANNVLKSAPLIARAWPKYANRIATECLSVQNAEFPKPQCHEIAAGQLIQTLGELFDLLDERRKQDAIEFVEEHCNSTRASTSKKAQKFLKKFAPS